MTAKPFGDNAPSDLQNFSSNPTMQSSTDEFAPWP